MLTTLGDNVNLFQLGYMNQHNPRKYTTAEIKIVIEKEGWAIAHPDWQYQGNKIKIPLVCPNGHRYDKRYNDFQQGKRCAECSGVKKLATSDVVLFIQSLQWTISDPFWEYVDNKSKIPLVCPNGHKTHKSYADFQKGSGCWECSGVKKLDTKDVVYFIQKEGWTIADPCWEYKNNLTKIPLVCPNGHKSDKTYSDFRQGYRCLNCRGTGRRDIAEILSFVQQAGWKIADPNWTYKNNWEHPVLEDLSFMGKCKEK
ncbi:MAG: hypothetical protein V7L23_31675 [Nostoc sp.]|uniref:hypothetical protein n=1 Tax=Nostoc sp. TaxID=1180 RepID=UPI002FEF1A15